MFELAVQDVSHGLKSAVRVIRSAYGFARAVRDGAHLIQQKERIHGVSAWTRERTADDEATPFALTMGRNDLTDFADVRAHPQ
jgi:hypothetical protein